ncbi:hypothetical protein FRB95_004079 [Tulasnella sp. JGI-2019a]|nr:hypothetical protein FRB95_004079 [Tulasnella sp. JGI-2019a]
MSQIINTRLGRVKDALKKNTPDVFQLSGLWQDLLVCIDGPTDDVVDQWMRLSSSDLVTSVPDLLMTAIDGDATGVSGVYAVELANRCAISVQIFLKNYSQKGLVAIPTWWNKFRYLIPQYIRDSALDNNLHCFVDLFGFCGRADVRAADAAVTASVDLHDFLLFASIFLELHDSLKATLHFTINAATTSGTPRPMSRLLNLPTIREHLKSRPDALYLRFKEFLDITDTYGMFIAM